jgi:hypothetical protein
LKRTDGSLDHDKAEIMLSKLLSKVSNQDLTAALHAAEDHTRRRLLSRSKSNTESLLQASNIPTSLIPRATVLLDRVGALIGVPVGVFRSDDELGTLLRVQTSELSGGHRAVLERHGVGSQLEVFGYKLFHLVEQLSDRQLWRKQWNTLSPRPQTEDDWIEAIMRMDIAQFLTFFAAIMHPT